MKASFGKGASFLSLLKDIDSSALSNNQILVYNETLSKWIPQTASAGGAVSLNDLTDVNTIGFQDGYIIQFNAVAGQWIAVDGSGAGGGIATEQDVIGFTVTSNKVVTVSAKALREVPFNCTLLGWKLIVDTNSSNSAIINIHKTTDFMNYTSIITNSLERPSITNQKNNENFILNGWTTTVNKNEVLRFSIDEAQNVKQVHFFLTIERNVS